MTSHNYRTLVSQLEIWLLSMAYARLSSRNQIPKFILGVNVIWTDHVKDEQSWSEHKKTHQKKKMQFTFTLLLLQIFSTDSMEGINMWKRRF